MTRKEFSKLTRQELLKLLLTQGQEQKRLEEQMSEMMMQKRELERSYERLKKRLNDKDEQIEHLKGRLDNKDARIMELETISKRENALIEVPSGEAGSTGEAAIESDSTFETEQLTVDHHAESMEQQSAGSESIGGCFEKEREHVCEYDWDFNIELVRNRKENAKEDDYDWDFDIEPARNKKSNECEGKGMIDG